MGNVDLATVDQVRSDLRAIVAGCDRDLLVDCTRLRVIDSTGIMVLQETYRDLKAQGREMLVANVAPECRAAFDVFGVSDLLRYDRTVA